jgi:DNA-binding transcriptional LysR family regulator
MNRYLNAIVVFATVAELRSFRAAADRLGVTRSAVSQAVLKLEELLGIALLQRTTRSVNLTEAGAQLLARVAPAISDIDTAMEATAAFLDRPRGQLRIAVSSIAENFLSGPLLASFIERHPEVHLDIVVTDEEFDIVASGYDAGVRLGEVIEQDMIAVPVSRDQQQLAVCSPSYLKRAGSPQHPRDLAQYRCIGWRSAPGVSPYRWEFGENGRAFNVEVTPEITTNDMRLMIRLACEGAGITFGMADTFQPWIKRGALVAILVDYCPILPGFFLYFPSRRNLAPKLRALLDHVRDFKAVLRR